MSKRNKNRKKEKGSKSDKNRTPISGHTRKGKELFPPFAKIASKMTFSSWMNDRLPEMVWAALILASVGQDYALGQFRRILNYIGNHEKREFLSDITLTGLSKLNLPLREEIIAFILEPPEAAKALATLRLFENIPARESWHKLLPEAKPNIDLLMTAIGATLWHQSQEATDCRWLRLMAQVVTGKFHIPEEIAKGWLGYPNEGDQRSVRPSIRAAEISHDPFEPTDLTWPKAFWEEAWHNTPCFAMVGKNSLLQFENNVTRQQIEHVLGAIEEHWERTHSTTAIDARHDAVFGMAFYSIRILQELLGIGIGNSILGRLGLRTILEVRVNLHYLLKKGDEELWEKWRTYGAGQAKLNALKFGDDLYPPKHINIESIEQIDSEDIWEEFLTINIGNWSGLDLRRLSEQADLKDVYDSHYLWTSGYSHGAWGPVRESCYQTCGNPLHRLHRYPERRSLAETVEDAAHLVDCILNDVDIAYPDFPHRINPKKEREKI